MTIEGEQRRVVLRVDRDINDPKALDRSIRAAGEAVEQPGGADIKGKITPRLRWSPKAARLSDLRSAFLLGFAHFGYRFALNDRLRPVRLQLADPDQQILPSFLIRFEEPPPLDQPHIGLATHPTDAFIVYLRDHLYILPVPWGLPDLYQELPKIFGSRRRDLKVRGITFPDRMRMVLDHMEP